MIDANESQPLSLWRYVKRCAGFGLKPSDLPLQRRFLYLTFGWAVAYVFATFAITKGWIAGILLWLAIGVPFGFAVAALWSYLTLLRRMDELMRQVQFEGIAIGFGIALLITLGYVLLERTGAPPMTSSTVIALLMVSWAVGQLIAVRRFLR